MCLNQHANRANLLINQTVILRQLDGGFEPTLGFAVGALYMHMHARFFAGEKLKPEAIFTQNGRAQ
jgi:hypothetical protein